MVRLKSLVWLLLSLLFTIVPILAFSQPITMRSPIGGESWAIGSTQRIQWASNNTTGSLLIQLNRNFPSDSGWTTIGQATTQNDGFSWLVTGPASHTSRIRVVNSSTLIGGLSSSNFSITDTVVAPHLTLIYPHGGEIWQIGSQQRITWLAINLTGTVTVQLNRTLSDSGWTSIGTANLPSDGFTWTVTGPASAACRIRIVGANGISYASQAFAIAANLEHSIIVTAPIGGETWEVGSTHNISWVAINITGTLTVQLNRNAPSDTGWTTLGQVTAPTSVYSWTVTGPAGNHNRIRVVTTVNNATISASSFANFTITSNEHAGLVVIAPTGGENWVIGTVQRITWQATQLTGTVTIRINRNFPNDSSWTTIGTATLPSDGFSWTVTGAASEHCRISIAAGILTAISHDNFRISEAPAHLSITLTQPNGGEGWSIGSRQEINWNSTGVVGTLVVQLNRHYPTGEWSTLGTLSAEHHSLNWVVTGPTSSTCRVRVRAISYNTDISATSHENFSIVAHVAPGANGSAATDMVRTNLPQNTMLIAPNPFNPTTSISYKLEADGFVRISVFDILGREISTLVNETQSTGIHTVQFNGLKMPSGLYFVSLKTPSGSSMRKMYLLK